MFKGFRCLVLVQLIFLANCGKNPEDVQRELKELGINYNEASFLETVEEGDSVATRLFLEAGMNPNIKTEPGLSALMVAAQNGHVAVMENLLAGGADIAYRTNFGDSVLKRAATTGQTRVVEYLLDQHRVDINLADEDGNTPLSIAALRGYLNTVKALLERGADAKLSNKNGETALDDALRFKELVDLGLINDAREYRVDELIELLQ